MKGFIINKDLVESFLPEITARETISSLKSEEITAVGVFANDERLAFHSRLNDRYKFDENSPDSYKSESSLRRFQFSKIYQKF